jgi:plasmid stabilization system protein ParE
MLVAGAGCDFYDAREDARTEAIKSARQGLDEFRDSFSYELQQVAGQTGAGQNLRDEIEAGLRKLGKDSHVIAVTADGSQVTAQFAVKGTGEGGGGGTYEKFFWVTCASVTGVPALKPAPQVAAIPCPVGFPPPDVWQGVDAIGPLPAD